MMGPEFWHMGGYARYVWPCFGLALGVLGWNLWSARRLHARAVLHAERALIMARADAGARGAESAGAQGTELMGTDRLARSERS
jgi:heme exporter protein CcmD